MNRSVSIREGLTMNRNEGYAGAGFALGVVAGVVVGAGVALLFAPKPGRELRHDLGESMGHLGKTVADKYHDMTHRAAHAVETTVNRAADRAESAARQFGQELDRRS